VDLRAVIKRLLGLAAPAVFTPYPLYRALLNAAVRWCRRYLLPKVSINQENHARQVKIKTFNS
jgi:hypothetical protein